MRNVSEKSCRENQNKYFPRILLRMRNVAEKSCRENQNKYFIFNNVFPLKNLAFYGIMWQIFGREGQATDEYVIQCMLFACWIPKATDTNSEHVLTYCFLLQQCLHGRASMFLLYYIACLFIAVSGTEKRTMNYINEKKLV